MVVDAVLLAGAGPAATCTTATGRCRAAARRGVRRRSSCRCPTAPTRRTTGRDDDRGGVRYSTFCTCSRIRSSSAFMSTMIGDTCSPSDFDPMVFTSRFISCSRKSSFRPHGSAPAGEVVPVYEVGAEPDELLADVRAGHEAHHFLRHRRRIEGQAAAEIADPLVQPRPQDALPLRRGVGDALDGRGQRRRAGRRGRRAAARLPGAASRRAPRARRRAPSRRRASAGPLRPRATRPAPRAPPAPAGSAADRRAASAPLTTPSSRARSIAAATRPRERLVELDDRRRHAPRLHADGDFDAAARQPLLDLRAQRVLGGGERRRHAQLHVEEAMVDALDRDAGRRALRLVRGAGKPGHRRDHGRLVEAWGVAAAAGAAPGAAPGRPGAAAPFSNICSE